MFCFLRYDGLQMERCDVATPSASAEAPTGVLPAPENAPPTALQKEIEAQFFALMRRVHLHTEARTQAFGLTFQQALALRHLEERAPMRGLAENLRCDASYITSIADALEARGLVRRRPDPSDRRVKQLELTAEGRKLKGELEGRLLEDSPLFRGLSEAEQGTLNDLLHKLTRPEG